MFFREISFSCLKVSGRCLSHENILNKMLKTVLLLIAVCACSQAEDVQLSGPVSAFINTTNYLIHDQKLGAQLYDVPMIQEKILKEYFNLFVERAAVIGSNKPYLIGNIYLQNNGFHPLLTNYDAEVLAFAHTAGRLLEDKGVLPDVNTAVQKAHEIVGMAQSRIDELPSGYLWTDLFSAMQGGFNAFFDQNVQILPTDLVVMLNRLFEYVSKFQ